MSAWIDALQFGDAVIVCHNSGVRRVARVVRMTATQVLIGSPIMRFRRRDGEKVGDDHSSRAFLRPYTAEEAAVMEAKWAREATYAALSQVSRQVTESLTLAQCQEIMAMLHRFGLAPHPLIKVEGSNDGHGA